MKEFIIKLLKFALMVICAPSFILLAVLSRLVYGKDWDKMPPVSNNDDIGWLE